MSGWLLSITNVLWYHDRRISFVPQQSNAHWTIHPDFGENRYIGYFPVVFKKAIPTLSSNLSLMISERRLHNLIYYTLEGSTVTMILVFQIEGQFLYPCITHYLSLLGQFLFFLKSEIRNSHVTTDRMYIGLNNIYEYKWFRCWKLPCHSEYFKLHSKRDTY
jgi:hypothetical protein